MKILITGSRRFESINKVKSYLDCLGPDDFILCGDAQGVDQYVHDYWVANNRFKYKQFKADLDHCVDNCKPEHRKRNSLGKSYCPMAGFRRNLEMLDELPQLVWAFWDGVSPGTKSVIDIALKRNINISVIFDI